MRLERYFCLSYDEDLKKQLTKCGVNVRVPEGVLNSLMTFTLYEDQENYAEVKALIPTEKGIGTWIFTKAEMEEASFLTMRSTNMKLEAKNLGKTYEYSCYSVSHMTGEAFGMHRRQVAPFEFSKPVKWGKNFFYSSYDGGYETMFCNDVAKATIESEGFSGVRFAPVLRYKKDCILEDIHQVVIDNILPDEALIIDDGFKEIQCSMCGKIRYGMDNVSRIIVRHGFIGKEDFYVTNELFGETYTSPINIISQRAYQALIKKGMGRSMCFQPLQIK